MALHAVDMVVVIIYLVAVVGIGVAATRRLDNNRPSIREYFLAGRQMSWLPVGASLFVSNIGAEHLVGLAGSGAAMGIAVGAWELNALILLQLLSWVFLPIYIATRIYTVPEYLAKRYEGHRLRLLLAVISILLYITTRISADLLTAGIFVQQAVQWDLYASIGALLVLAGAITLLGGLRAVIYTETLQMFVIVGGSLILAALSFHKVGGFAGLVRAYPSIDICGAPGEPWQMLRHARDPHMPWAGFVFGQTPASIWYWCTDQVIVQRVLAAKSLAHGRGATLLAGFLKLLPLFTMAMPGMISRVLFPDEVGCATPEACFRVCQNRAGCSNVAYSRLVMGLLPTGLRGVLLAALIASLMGSLESTLNSATSLFTLDIYQSFRPGASTRERLFVGRLFLLLLTGVSVAWVPIAAAAQGGQIFLYMQEASNYLAPQVAALYLLSILWGRANETGAFYGLSLGFALGLTRLVASMLTLHTMQAHICSAQEPSRVAMWMGYFMSMHHMYFGLLTFVVTLASVVLLSLLTAPPPPRLLHNTTVWTLEDRQRTLHEKMVELPEGHRDDMYSDPMAVEDWKVASDKTEDAEHMPSEKGGPSKDDMEHGRRPSGEEMKEADADEMGQEEGGQSMASRLAVSKREGRVLNACMGIVLVLGLGSYVLWSTWDPRKTFGTVEAGAKRR